MGGKLLFKTDDVRRVVEHAMKSDTHKPVFSDLGNPKPAIWLVGDQGVYLMSNGIPADIKEPGCSKSPIFVAYALGCDPQIDDEWYDKKNTIFGGDDGIEALPWCEEILERLGAHPKKITISVSADEIRLL